MKFDFSAMNRTPSATEYDDDGVPILSWQQECGTQEGTVKYIQFRNDLLEKVRTGEVTPKDAEKAAIKNGGEPLEVRFRPPASPPVIAMWSPEMVAAWISRKELNSVLRHREEFWRGRSIWIENQNVYRWPIDKPAFLQQSRRGYDLVALGKTSLFAAGFDFDGHRFDYSDMKWFEKLREMLVEGEMVKATARRRSNGQLTQIKAGEWQFLEFGRSENGGTILCKPGNAPIYEDITFLAREVRSCFSQKSGFAQERPNITGFRRWKIDIEKQPKGKRRFLYSLLTKTFPDGFPLHYKSDSERLQAIRELLADGYWHTDEDSFKRYLNGVLKEYCED
ncbi:hypothetical protein LJR030_002865 [Rhizobium sp. LjRoot30]|uniref:hypothetical protein n=1 Tax=Rhizobium sp. LjRoot30 TaxID=3342320 RepID=UPI003ED0BEBF